MKKTFGMSFTRDMFVTLVGAVLYSFALAVFLSPSKIIIGGAGGIAITLNALFDLPIGVMLFLINTPLLVACTIVYGKVFVLRSLIGVLLTSVFTDVMSLLPPSESERLVCALLGGLCLGSGAGMMFYTGVTTGGSDLCACLLKRKLKNVSMGRLILYCDTVIVCVCAVFIGSAQGLLYSVVGGVSAAISIDVSQGFLVRSRLVLVITDRAGEVSRAISEKVQRGMTIVDCRGWYSNEKKSIVMCVMRGDELVFAKQQIEAADPDAFVVVGTAKTVYGRGFDTKGI